MQNRGLDNKYIGGPDKIFAKNSYGRKIIYLKENHSTYISQGEKHRLENNEKYPLVSNYPDKTTIVHDYNEPKMVNQYTIKLTIDKLNYTFSIQIEEIKNITFSKTGFYQVNLVSQCSHLEVLLLSKFGSERGDLN